jgi:putative transposase
MKYHKNLFDPKILNFLKTLYFEFGQRYCFEFDAIGCYGDHIHIFRGDEPKPKNILFQE